MPLLAANGQLIPRLKQRYNEMESGRAVTMQSYLRFPHISAAHIPEMLDRKEFMDIHNFGFHL